MIYGYLRVSTDMQDKNSQKQGVDEFAVKKGCIYTEWNNPGLRHGHGGSGLTDMASNFKV